MDPLPLPFPAPKDLPHFGFGSTSAEKECFTPALASWRPFVRSRGHVASTTTGDGNHTIQRNRHPAQRRHPRLQGWPQRWRYQDSDIALGERILECLTLFLLYLLEQGLATKTLQRHRDHLWMLGGEIIRRLHEEPALRRRPIKTVIVQLMDPECGPLIWPRITQQQQNSFDATCRKLYQFLTTNL